MSPDRNGKGSTLAGRNEIGSTSPPLAGRKAPLTHQRSISLYKPSEVGANTLGQRMQADILSSSLKNGTKSAGKIVETEKKMNKEEQEK